MAAEYQFVFITASDSAEAERIARALVEASLAACVNLVVRARSIYRWKGEIVDDEEVLMIAKIRKRDFRVIEEKVTAMHSYDVPEIVGVDLASISKGYRRFLEDTVGD